jgi:hypothetical protein
MKTMTVDKAEVIVLALIIVISFGLGLIFGF